MYLLTATAYWIYTLTRPRFCPCSQGEERTTLQLEYPSPFLFILLPVNQQHLSPIVQQDG